MTSANIISAVLLIITSGSAALYVGSKERKKQIYRHDRYKRIMFANARLPRDQQTLLPDRIDYNPTLTALLVLTCVFFFFAVILALPSMTPDGVAGFLVYCAVFFLGEFFALLYFFYYYMDKCEEQLPEPPPESPAAAQPPSEPPPPFTIPASARLEHTLVLAGTGGGKTQLLSTWIAADLKKPVSLVVFDSQGDLVQNILKADFPRSRVVVIDPTDVHFPVGLQLFKTPSEAESAYETEKNLNSTIELLLFVLSSLDSSVTAKQELPLRMLITLCMYIPGANINTLLDLLNRDKFKNYEQFVGLLPDVPKEFFKTDYHSRAFQETLEQIRRRIFSIMSNTTLHRMFSAQTSKLDMRSILDDGSVVLINTAKSFLKDEGSVFFTRFMTALIFQAIQERNPNANNIPVYMYIDEAAPVISEQTANILETGRKYKLGMHLAFQSLSQIPHDLQNRIVANTTIKAVGTVSAKDARALADDMGTNADTLMGLPRLDFMVRVKGHGTHVLTVHPGKLEALPRRTDLKQLISENRARYAYKPENGTPPKPSHPEPDNDIE